MLDQTIFYGEDPYYNNVRCRADPPKNDNQLKYRCVNADSSSSQLYDLWTDF